MTKALVLLSGGQDSTTVLFWAKHRLEAEVHTLSVRYGQTHIGELEAARKIAAAAGALTITTIDVDDLFAGSKSALVSGSGTELAGEGGMPDKEMPQGLPTSFVPGRNLLFSALAASRAGALGAEHIVLGVCQTDYSGYPDCRMTFINAMQAAINEAWPSGGPAPQIHTPLMSMTKAETVKLATELPGCMDALAYSITCYRGQRPGCGDCAACALRIKGFEDAGVPDPSA